MRIRCVSALAILAIVLMAACGSSSKSSSSTTTTVPRNFNVETPEGQVSLSLDGQLPPNWPSSFPVPSGANPAGSGSLVKDANGALIGVYSSTQAPGDAYGFYKNNSSLAITKSGSLGSGDKYVGTIELGGSYYAGSNVTVVSSGGTTYIVVTLKSGSSTTTTT